VRTKHYLGARLKSEPMVSQRKQIEETEITTLPIGTSERERWKLAGCPRCHGDVFLDSENGEVLGHCLQCGYVGTSVVTPTLKVNRND